MHIKFQSILNLSQDGATSSVLILDDLHILLDCGVNENVDITKYIEHSALLNKIDLILLSHPGYEYSGALSFILSLLTNKPLIYATIPVSRISVSNIIDLLLNKFVASDFCDFNFREYQSKCFEIYEKIHEVKFLEKKTILLRGKNILLIANKIGHTLGSCAWQIEIDLVSIVYLISYNHKSENHLDGLVLDEINKKKVDLLITSTNNIDKQPIKEPNILERKIKEYIEKCNTFGGLVFICCFSTEQILEILIVIENILKEKPEFSSISYELFHTYKNLIDIAKSQIEFMKTQLCEQLSTGTNPFEAKNVKFHKDFNYNLLDSANNKRIIISNYPFLNYGPLQNLFVKGCGDERNTLVLIGEPTKVYTDFARLKDNFSGRLEFINLEKNTFNISTFQDYDPEKLFVKQSEMAMNIESKASVALSDTLSTTASTNTFKLPPPLISNAKIKKNEKNEVLFIFNDFPQYFFDEKKSQISDYGQVLENDELKNWDEHESLLRKNFIYQFSEADNKENTEKKFFSYNDFNNLRCNNRHSKINLIMKMNVCKLDSCCLSDGQSMLNIINLLNPKNLLLINGDDRENKIIEVFLSQRNIPNKLTVSSYDKIYELDIENDFWHCELADPSNKSNFPFRISGEVNLIFNQDIARMIDKNLIIENVNNEENFNKRTLFFDVKLEKLYDYFNEKNTQPIFSISCLNFSNKVFIKKDNGKIVLEGIHCPEYYKIRNLLYSFFQT